MCCCVRTGAAVTDVEIGDLEELLGCKGWAWLMAQKDREWGPVAYAAKIEGIAAMAPDALVQQAQMNQVIVAKREIGAFLAKPAEEIQKRREQVKLRPDDLSGQRRRGGTL